MSPSEPDEYKTIFEQIHDQPNWLGLSTVKGNAVIKGLTVSTEDSLTPSSDRDDSLDSDEDLNFSAEENNDEDPAEKLQNALLMMRDSTVCEQFFEHY